MTLERKKNKSPYLADPHRLANVIAAIQVMGTYKFYKSSITKWAKRISGQNQDGSFWNKVFAEHPEFFMLEDGDKAALVWRRTSQKLYHVELDTSITKEAYDKLSEKEKNRVSRKPLTPDDIGTLINTAIELHSRATVLERERRWWVPIVVGFIGVIVGGIIRGCS